MKVLFTILCVVCIGLSSAMGSVIDDLIGQITSLKESESMTMTYNFVGCYGAYQKGTIEFILRNDSIHYLSKSFDPELKKSINQSGYYPKKIILDLLRKAKEVLSEEVLGNAIHYRFKREGEKIYKGHDSIDQKHFIELFHPFSSFLQNGNLNKIQLNPKLKTPGISHQ